MSQRSTARGPTAHFGSPWGLRAAGLVGIDPLRAWFLYLEECSGPAHSGNSGPRPRTPEGRTVPGHRANRSRDDQADLCHRRHACSTRSTPSEERGRHRTPRRGGGTISNDHHAQTNKCQRPTSQPELVSTGRVRDHQPTAKSTAPMCGIRSYQGTTARMLSVRKYRKSR